MCASTIEIGKALLRGLLGGYTKAEPGINMSLCVDKRKELTHNIQESPQSTFFVFDSMPFCTWDSLLKTKRKGSSLVIYSFWWAASPANTDMYRFPISIKANPSWPISVLYHCRELLVRRYPGHMNIPDNVEADKLSSLSLRRDYTRPDMVARAQRWAKEIVHNSMIH